MTNKKGHICIIMALIILFSPVVYANDWDDMMDDLEYVFDQEWCWQWKFFDCNYGHTYNIVLYQGSYRIMDYGPLGDFFYSNTYDTDMYQTDHLWNDHIGEFWVENHLPEEYAYNYPGVGGCPNGSWTDQTYYIDVCAGNGTNTGTDHNASGSANATQVAN